MAVRIQPMDKITEAMVMDSLRISLGKIKSVRVGLGNYQECMYGYYFTLGTDASSVNTSWCTWDPATIVRSDYCNWTEADRDTELAMNDRKMSQLLKDAKVDNVNDLIGIPVVITFAGDNVLRKWRILKEVL